MSLTVYREVVLQTAGGCRSGGTALLRTRFALDDQVHAPVTFNVEQPWTSRSRS